MAAQLLTELNSVYWLFNIFLLFCYCHHAYILILKAKASISASFFFNQLRAGQIQRCIELLNLLMELKKSCVLNMWFKYLIIYTLD